MFKDPKAKATGNAAFYGMAATIGDRSLVDRFARGFCDAFYIPYIKHGQHEGTHASGAHGHSHGGISASGHLNQLDKSANSLTVSQGVGAAQAPSENK